MNHEPLPGRYALRWCTTCNRPAGSDCNARVITPRRTRRATDRALRALILEATWDRRHRA